jgi:hypothetical protein
MKSPFPGMDPYLEARWSDVHGTIISAMKEALQPMLPPDLRARQEERVLLETSQRERLSEYRADVAVVNVEGRAAAAAATPAATLEPIVVEVQPRTVVDRSLRIIDVTHGNRVVTAIEVLSPWNKRASRLNRLYRRKLADYGRTRVSVVEIDLLRSSRHRLPVGQADLPANRRTPYLVCIRRGWKASRWELYPIPLRLTLPPVPVPLRKNEPDIAVDLQAIIERAYTAGGHDDIDYRKPPEPPLEAEDAAWAEALLKEAGRR